MFASYRVEALQTLPLSRPMQRALLPKLQHIHEQTEVSTAWGCDGGSQAHVHGTKGSKLAAQWTRSQAPPGRVLISQTMQQHGYVLMLT